MIVDNELIMVFDPVFNGPIMTFNGVYFLVFFDGGKVRQRSHTFIHLYIARSATYIRCRRFIHLYMLRSRPFK